MATIEHINSKLNDKIIAIKKLMLEAEQHTKICSSFQRMFFEKIIEEYEFGSIQILSEYYFLDETHDFLERKSNIYHEYIRFIIRIGIVQQLDQMLHNMKLAAKKLPSQIVKKIASCENMKLRLSVKKTNGSLCEFCNRQMTFIAKESVLECPSCFAQITAKGMMILEDRDNITDKSYRKSQHQSRKHGKEWLDSLQGLENKEIPKSVIDHVLSCMQKDRIIDKSVLSCDTIRSYLSRTSTTAKYNQQIPKIRKLVTGIEPPQLTYAETELFLEYYGRVMNIYNEKKKKTNSLYCPYKIRKILEQILRGDENKQRREKFYSYIHLQLSETLIDQDRMWEEICDEIPEFEYQPTIRSL